MIRLLALVLLFVSMNAQALLFSDIKFGTKQFGDAQWNVSACQGTTTCTSSAQNVGSMRNGSGQNFTLGSTQYLKFSYTNTDPAEPWTLTAYNANGTVAAVLGTYRIINAGEGYFMTSNQPYPNAGNGTLWSTQTGMVSSSKTYTETLQPTKEQMDVYADAYYSPDPIYVAGQTYTPVSTLCCGGSSAAFTVSPTHTNKLNTFNNRSTADSRVYVEQIGNDNTINIDQSGTRNNSVTYTGNGSFNSVDITQSSTSPTATNYTEVTVNGNSNTIDLTQNSTGGTKSAFVTVTDNNNTVNINQKDSGNHYLNLNLSGGNKSADILQQGAGAHQADITLSGAGARSINLIQQGTTAQSYSINSSCVSNCQAISVTQGQ